LICEHVLDRVGGREVAFKECTQLLEFGGVFSRKKNGVGGDPWRRALKRTAARPSGVFGPPLAPLRRLAMIWRAEAIGISADMIAWEEKILRVESAWSRVL
jgi:hypothetical protein